MPLQIPSDIERADLNAPDGIRSINDADLRAVHCFRLDDTACLKTIQNVGGTQGSEL